MRSKWVMGNWKMNGSLADTAKLTSDIIDGLTATAHKKCVILPPALFMESVSKMLSDTDIGLGIQNFFPKDGGAFTGENSLSMVEHTKCHYALIGHSERRHIFNETEKFIAEKFHHAKEHGMIPVLCVGETLDERNKGLTDEVLYRQISTLLYNDATCFNDSIVAYEPVWAIGTGINATADQAQQAHAHIRKIIAASNQASAANLSILYGGSVNEQNADEIFAMPDVDGGLVGGASLNARKFVEIVKCIN